MEWKVKAEREKGQATGKYDEIQDERIDGHKSTQIYILMWKCMFYLNILQLSERIYQYINIILNYEHIIHFSLLVLHGL